MNTFVTLLLIYHISKLIDFKWSLSFWQKFSLYLGALLPLGDQILRLIQGEVWYHIEALYFHNLVYQSFFWGVIAFLHFVYSKSFRQSVQFLLPLLGIGFYLLISIFSTGSEHFLSPFTIQRWHLHWVLEGYLIPFIFLFFFWVLAKWITQSKKIIHWTPILFLVIFVSIMGGVKYKIESSLQQKLSQAESIKIFPKDFLQRHWQIIAYHQGKYQTLKYDLFQDQFSEIATKDFSVDLEIAQGLLLDPLIHKLTNHAFRNPVFEVEMQNEALSLKITEIVPLNEFLWLSQFQLKKNRSGQNFALTASRNFFQYGVFE